jgi:hypothetical protein
LSLRDQVLLRSNLPSDAIATFPVVAGLRSGLRLLPWRVPIEPARSGPASLESAFGRDRDLSGCRGVAQRAEIVAVAGAD